MAKAKTKNKGAVRVIGRNGESMQVEGDELCFSTKNKVEHIPLEVLSDLYICNTEEAREAVTTEELIPYGIWTKEMPSVGGKSVFLVAKGRVSLWVMEINRSQVPNASSFVKSLRPEEDDDSKLKIPNRAIDTPLGAVLTVGSIVCAFSAIFSLYSFNQPILALVFAIAAIIMFFNVK